MQLVISANVQFFPYKMPFHTPFDKVGKEGRGDSKIATLSNVIKIPETRNSKCDGNENNKH